MKTLLLGLFGLILSSYMSFWGFYAHKKINRLAVFTLPPEMIGFYKKNIHHIIDMSVTPDKRRYVVPSEGPRHFLDVDHYGDSAFSTLPPTWEDAVNIYSEDSLLAHGTLPWHIHRMYLRLRDAFMVRDVAAILRISAELGHYVADAHVPLHTTKNYNGQLTGQEGIHGLWESRLPEVFSDNYDFFVGRAEYVQDPQRLAWQVIAEASSLVDEVLKHEKMLASRYQEKKYSHETRGNTTAKVYAFEFSRAYHSVLDGMIERQMRASIRRTGSLWFTAWADAGQPDLNALLANEPTEEELQENRTELAAWKAARFRVREHE